jgi:hypothetical protein
MLLPELSEYCLLSERTESSPEEPTANFGILYVWEEVPDPRAPPPSRNLQGPFLRQWETTLISEPLAQTFYTHTHTHTHTQNLAVQSRLVTETSTLRKDMKRLEVRRQYYRTSCRRLKKQIFGH